MQLEQSTQKKPPYEIKASSSYFSSNYLLSFLLRWKYAYAISLILATIVSVILSGPKFVTPKYKSVTVLYPSATNSVSKAIMYESIDPLSIGHEMDADRLIQLLYSNQIRDSIISEFDLTSHYNINPESPMRNNLLQSQYADNVKINRTQYMSVEISVLDKDPVKAAAIANRISDLVDYYKLKMVIKNAEKTSDILRFQCETKKDLVSKLNDSLMLLRSLGAYDYDLEADHVTEQYISALSENISESEKLKVYIDNNLSASDTMVIRTKGRIKGSEAAVKLLEKKLELLTKYGGAYNAVRSMLIAETHELNVLQQKLERSMIDVRESMPAKFTVNYAQVAERSAYPVRWLIVLISLISVCIFTTLILVVVDTYDKNASKFGMDL
jgi:capsular polysaccharide biosynthesis protein